MPLEVFINRLLCALVAGVAIGVERQLRKRNAGLAKSTAAEWLITIICECFRRW